MRLHVLVPSPGPSEVMFAHGPGPPILASGPNFYNAQKYYIDDNLSSMCFC